MKKLNFIFTFLLLFNLESNADWKAKLRPQCYWWRAKYLAEVTLSSLDRNELPSSRQKNCDGVQATVIKRSNCTYGADSAYSWAWSFPPYYYGGIGRSVTNGCLYWKAGKNSRYEINKFKSPPLNKSITREDPIAYQENKITASSVTFNSSTKLVSLTDLQGYVVVENSESIYNGYTVAILRIQTALADSLIDSIDSSVIWEGKVIMANGELTLSGNFNSSNLIITEIPLTNGKKYTFSASSFNIILPESTDMDNIEVEFSGDCGETENGVPQTFLTGNEKISSTYLTNFDYFVFPNPTTDIVNLKITLQKEKIKKIYLKSYEGKTVKKINRINKYSNGIIPIDCTDLTKGAYFVGIEVGDKIYYRKFIIK